MRMLCCPRRSTFSDSSRLPGGTLSASIHVAPDVLRAGGPPDYRGARDVFRLAIALEKDAILFFWEFLPYVSDKDKKLVRTLIDEEKGHIRLLWKMKQELGQ
mgnify:CR=1 FL=1